MTCSSLYVQFVEEAQRVVDAAGEAAGETNFIQRSKGILAGQGQDLLGAFLPGRGPAVPALRAALDALVNNHFIPNTSVTLR